MSKVESHHISVLNTEADVQLRPDDIIVYDGKLNYNKKDKNPVDSVRFYSSRNITSKLECVSEKGRVTE